MSATGTSRDSLAASSSKVRLSRVEELGPPYVHLQGFHPSQLPVASATAEDLEPLLESILSEGVLLVANLPDSNSPSTFVTAWRFLDKKYFVNVHGAVHLYEKTVTATDLRNRVKKVSISPDLVRTLPETWFLRKSIHQNNAISGSAGWDEFVECFKQDHAKYEKEFTSTVIDTNLLHSWDCSGLELKIEGDDQIWENVTLKREESTHKLPFPLKDRVFPVLQLTASVQGKKEFIVVQISIRDDAAEARSSGKVLRGAYTSVERLRELDDGQIEWVMGTTSDSRGVLPGWVVKKAVPGAIAKDVEMFIAWIGRERRERNVIVFR